MNRGFVAAVRPIPLRVGARAWIAYIGTSSEIAGRENGLGVTIAHIEDKRKVTVRDGRGREIVLPHYFVTTGDEYRGKAGWVPESDSRVLDYLEQWLGELERERWQPAIENDRLAVIARMRGILARNGRGRAVGCIWPITPPAPISEV